MNNLLPAPEPTIQRMPSLNLDDLARQNDRQRLIK